LGARRFLTTADRQESRCGTNAGFALFLQRFFLCHKLHALSGTAGTMGFREKRSASESLAAGYAVQCREEKLNCEYRLATGNVIWRQVILPGGEGM